MTKFAVVAYTVTGFAALVAGAIEGDIAWAAFGACMFLHVDFLMLRADLKSRADSARGDAK